MDVISIRLGKIFNNIKTKISVIFNYAKSEEKYFSFLSVVFILIIIGLIFPSGSAHAFWDEVASGILGHVIYPLVYVIFYILFYIAYIIAWLGAVLVSANLNPELMNSVLTSPGIKQGWEIFRDIANLLFILILLLVAFGTIFRSDTYNAKKSLPSLIIAAFLINFSAMITGVVIDFCNILMYGILKMMCAGNDQCAQDFTRMLFKSINALKDMHPLAGSVKGFISWEGISVQSVVSMAIAAVYTFIYGLVLVALAVFLLIRIAALAILIILSPLAFFGQVAPGLKGISNKWWDNLLQYAFFGPIFALLLYVTGLMASTTFTIGSTLISQNPELGAFTSLLATIIANIIPLIFLLAIIPITKSMGIAGANAVMDKTVGLAGKVGSFAKSYATDSADRWLARGAQAQGTGILARARRAMAVLSPGAWKRAYKAHTADQERDYDVAAGAHRNKLDPYGAAKDRYNKWRDPNYKSSRPDYKQRAKDIKAELEFKAQGITNVDEMIDETKTMMEKGINPELSMKNFRWIAAEGGTDDLLERMGFERGAQGLSDLLQKYYDQGSSTGYKNLNDEHLSKFSSDISKAEKKNKSINYEGVGKFDTTTGGYVFNRMSNATERDAQKADQIKAYNTLEERNRLRGTKGGNYVNRAGVVTDTGVEMLRQIKGRDLDQVKGMARKDAQMIHDGLKSRFGTPTFVPATKTVPAHYNFTSGTPKDIKEAWNRIMVDKDIS